MIWAVVVLPAAVGAAVAENAQRRGTARLLKMAASTLVVVYAGFVAGDPMLYAWLVIGALSLSWVGDLALTFDGRRAFVTGLVAFAAAHVAYTVAFVARGGIDSVVLLAAAAGTTLFAIVVLRWLAPHRPDELGLPVAVYVVLISAMVATAFSSHAATPDLRIPAGAVAFAVSDLFVARQQFVTPSPWNRLIGLPLYFVAQLLLASTV